MLEEDKIYVCVCVRRIMHCDIKDDNLGLFEEDDITCL